MKQRAAGIFLHPTSLPSPFGIGDLGEDAIRWLDLLRKFDHTYWQVCPLSPTGFGDSPYQSLSSFAGNPLLISPARLLEDGLLDKSDLDGYPRLSEDRVAFGSVIEAKNCLFRKAYARFKNSSSFDTFCDREQYWLDDYALFRVLKDLHGGRQWTEWDEPCRMRRPAALRQVSKTQAGSIRYHKFLQYVFHAQWKTLHLHAQTIGVRIIGDIPCYVSFDSADTWASPELFELDSECRGGRRRARAARHAAPERARLRRAAANPAPGHKAESGARQLATYFVGQVVGQMNERKSTRRVVAEMIEEFAATMERMERLVRSE